MSTGDYPGRYISLNSWDTFRIQGRRAISVSLNFSLQRCVSAAEEIIRTEIRMVETEYSCYTWEQKRSLVRRRLQFLSRAAKKAVQMEPDDQRTLIHRTLTTIAYHRPPTQAESYASCYQGPSNNQPRNIEQPPEQNGVTPAYPIEVSFEHNPPSPMYTPRSPNQATDSAEEDPEEDFDWSGNEN
ncbi:hypothetical protein CsSME_00051444 [Camellia sinensis var. sinensis]